jgi:hypothetical protein
MPRMNDVDELAYEVVMARKFGEVLHVIKAIDFARNKARLESARAGEDFLAECQRGDGAGEWWVGEEAS